MKQYIRWSLVLSFALLSLALVPVANAGSIAILDDLIKQGVTVDAVSTKQLSEERAKNTYYLTFSYDFAIGFLNVLTQTRPNVDTFYKYADGSAVLLTSYKQTGAITQNSNGEPDYHYYQAQFVSGNFVTLMTLNKVTGTLYIDAAATKNRLLTINNTIGSINFSGLGEFSRVDDYLFHHLINENTRQRSGYYEIYDTQVPWMPLGPYGSMQIL